jgi:hypothetical protein
LVGALGVRARARWAWVVLELGPCARSASSSSWAFFFFLPSLSFLSHPFPAPHAPPPAAFATSAESPRRRLGVRVSIACGVSKRGFPFRFFSFGAKEPSRDRVLFVNTEHANTTIRAHVWATAHGQPQPHRNSDASAHPVRLTYQALTRGSRKKIKR